MSNVNSQSYKFLKAKSSNKRKSSYDFDRTLANITEELLPNTAAKQASKTTDNGDALERLTESYDKKLKQMEKVQNKRLGELGQNSENEIKRLGNQIQRGEEQNLELSDSLRAAIERIAQGRQQSAQQEGPIDEEEQPSEIASGTDYEDLLMDPDANVVVRPVKTTATPKKVEETVTSSVVKKAVNIGDSIGVGDHHYKVTNLFGLRTGNNAVSGREGQHSNGMDLVGFSADGKRSNLPIALTDGKIIGVNMQGDGSVVNPTKGKFAGVYIDLLMPDGKVMKYMHLGKDALANKADLIGKEIKRGDLLYEGDYSKGSGSQTGPHVKVSITSLDEQGKQLRDYSAPKNDPKTYALYGKYTEEH